jgi:hypothetical protein
MQPANLISSLQALSRSATPLIVTENTPSPAGKAGYDTTIQAPPLAAGQQVQATIQEQVSPGLYKVQVAGQTLQMQLPGLLKTGSQVMLQVISTSPKLTFGVAASSAPIATAEQISSTSRLLSNLAQLPVSRTLIESTTGRAVWQTTVSIPDSKQLAAGLRDALANSGLFYESHQAQWVAGERSTAQLLVEPQNQLSRDAQNMPGTAVSATQLDRDAQNTLSTILSASPQDKATTDSGLPIAKELVPLVQQQLHTLETHQLTWTGQVWPGQQMQWEIQGEPEHRPMQPDERQWSTEMELALPRLGDVHARLVFHQGGIKLTLHAADAGAIALFNRRLPGLAISMADAGIPLAGTVVEKS